MYLYLWVGFGILVVGGVVLLWYLSTHHAVPSNGLPYISTPLLTDAEKRFFTVLERTVPTQCYVLAQVRLANLVTVTPGTVPYWEHFKPIAMKCVDFVVVHRDTMSPILVIELDDRTHFLAERRKRDRFLDSVLGAVALPILHWPVMGYYNKEELAQAIMEKLG